MVVDDDVLDEASVCKVQKKKLLYVQKLQFACSLFIQTSLAIQRNEALLQPVSKSLSFFYMSCLVILFVQNTGKNAFFKDEIHKRLIIIV